LPAQILNKSFIDQAANAKAQGQRSSVTVLDPCYWLWIEWKSS